MKSVLYVAAILMIGASIYGFVDYNKTKGSKEFATMYDEKEKADLVIVEERKPTSDVVPVSKKEQPETVKEETLKASKENEKREVKKPVTRLKKKKKINYKSFSRAPLREEEVVEVPEIKETMIKEQ